VHRVVIDTNVLISAALSQSDPYKILHELVYEDLVISFSSLEILDKFSKVIGYPKFNRNRDFVLNARIVWEGFYRFSVLVQPTVILPLLKDSSDNKFLEVAVSGRADFLITGNAKDFPFKQFENTSIISPRDYWNAHWK
jgi:putative PIN family toxin of toxin-antitoxin system